MRQLWDGQLSLRLLPKSKKPPNKQLLFRTTDSSMRKEVVEVVALSTLLGCTILLSAIWFAAAATGNSLTVTVNRFGERTPELIMWVLLVPVISAWLYRRVYA